MGWLNSKSIELSSSDDPTLRPQIGWLVSRECSTDTRMCDPKCGRICKHREVQTQNEIKFDFQVKLGLEDQGRSRLKIIESQGVCTSIQIWWS